MSLSRFERLEDRLKRRQRIFSIPRKRLKDRQNPLDCHNSEEFKERFHVFKETAIYVSNLISNDLAAPINRGIQLQPTMQFLIAMRFFVTGSFQIVVGDLYLVSQSTVSAIVKRVAVAICKLRKRFIKFPTQQTAVNIRQDFYLMSKFPGVTGVVDGCHIKITSPGGDDAELFRNRKGVFSINVQGVCDAQLNFTDIVARWYGSVHDSRMFENSNLCSDLESGEKPGILLGDSGYALFPFLMVPLKNPATAQERRYQRALLTARNCIERCFGVWKRRFPCLNLMRLKLATTLTVIVATAVLHNISRSRSDIYEEDSYDSDGDCLNDTCISSSSTAKSIQRNLINTYFN